MEFSRRKKNPTDCVLYSNEINKITHIKHKFELILTIENCSYSFLFVRYCERVLCTSLPLFIAMWLENSWHQTRLMKQTARKKRWNITTLACLTFFFLRTFSLSLCFFVSFSLFKWFKCFPLNLYFGNKYVRGTRKNHMKCE